MPRVVPPVADERTALTAYLAHQRRALRATAYGLTDEQARMAASAGQLSIGGLIKHAARCEGFWTDLILRQQREPKADGSDGSHGSDSSDGSHGSHGSDSSDGSHGSDGSGSHGSHRSGSDGSDGSGGSDGSEFRLAPDETLADVLTAYAEASERTDAVITGVPDLGQAVPVPPGAPWVPAEVEEWSVRWVLLHLIEETARHGGHADIIRESIDGATFDPLLAAAEAWPDPWVRPWEPASPGGG
ncbi:DinB family protein [Streptomyces sp. NPDC053367]|uniref:DinB family protein n=1 Tax=Streptomyces sp. NPDC053367 TaxID=3365700 RepID=UPI0037D13452